jgi:hypothetical protein
MASETDTPLNPQRNTHWKFTPILYIMTHKRNWRIHTCCPDGPEDWLADGLGSWGDALMSLLSSASDGVSELLEI